MHRPRLRQREAGREADARCGIVDGDEHVGIAALAVDNERRP
jgi:hypothetical protein